MVLSRVRAALLPALYPTVMPTLTDWQEDPIGLYRLLRAYYDSTGLYETLAQLAQIRGVAIPARRPLRNPAHRVVEFYVTHLWPTELKIETDSEAIRAPIAQVWKWSNWDARRRLAARWFSLYGDAFIKVVSVAPIPDTADGRVYYQLLEPETVIDFDEDARGFMTWVHIEVDQWVRQPDGKLERVYYTEVWDRTRFRSWSRDRRQKLEELGPATVSYDLTEQFGIDFVPIVHAKFQDTGWKRGAGAFTHAIEKIDEANTQATRLHQLLFRHNNVNWAVTAGGNDAQGRPLPPPNVSMGSLNGASGDDGTIELGGETMIRLPGNSQLDSLVPNLNYAAALEVLNAQLAEIEHDLPEMAFHRIRELGEISGRAARFMLTDAIDKIIEARGNALQALARADMMALTIGGQLQLEGFTDLGGDFDSGAFEHTFEHEDPIGISDLEQAETDLAIAQAAIAQQESGLTVRQTLLDRGYSEEQVDKMLAEAEAEKDASAERAAQTFNAGAGAFGA